MARLRLTRPRNGGYLAGPVTFGQSRFMWMSGATCLQPTLVVQGPGRTMAMLDSEGHSGIARNDGFKPRAGTQSKCLE